MKKTNLFLKQCFAILVMGVMLFSISCSESDVDLDVEDDIVDPDLDLDDDDDNTSSENANTIAEFAKYVEAYAEYIPVGVVATLEELDAEMNGTPEDLVATIALHAEAIEFAAEGLVITSISNDVDTLSFTYRNAGVSGFTSICKGGVDVSVSDRTASSLVVIEAGDYSFSFPKGYATNVTGLTSKDDKIAIASGAKTSVELELKTLNDVGANGYLNHMSGFTLYAASLVSTKSTLEVISPEDLRVVSAEFASSINKREATISIMMSSDVNVDWGGEISIQYGSGSKTDDLTFTSLKSSEVQSIAYSYGSESMVQYDADKIDYIKYSYDPDALDYENSFYLYFTGIDNSEDEVVEDVVLSEDLAINSYEIKLYEILGADFDSGDVPVEFASDKNLLFGTSEEKSAFLEGITANVNVVDDDLYLGSLSGNVWDYITSKSTDDATINLNFALSSLSPQDTKNRVYLLVIAGTTTGVDENNCFVMSHVIGVKNDAEVYLRMYQDTETANSVDFQSGTLELSIESNYYWTVAEVEDSNTESFEWFTLSQTEGELDYTLEVAYDRNDNYESERSAKIRFESEKEYTGELIELVFEITQVVGESPVINFATYDGSTAEEDVTHAAGTIDVSVESNTSWTIVQQPSWANASIDGTVIRSGVEDATITINYDKNDSGGSRDDQFVFQITDSYKGKQTYGYIKLHQAEVVTPTIEIDNTSDRLFGSKGGEFNVDIESNFDWTITSDASWVTIPVSSGKYDESQIVICYDNHITDYESGREATVTFTASDDDNVAVKTIKILQNKAIEPATVSFLDATGLSDSYENITYTIKSDLTVDQIFGLSEGAINISDLETESDIAFNQLQSTGLNSTSVKSVQSVSLDESSCLLLDIPMTLSTNGEFTAETTLSYTDAEGISEVVVLNVEFDANGYPVTFQSCLENMIVNDGNEIPTSALTTVLAYQHTSSGVPHTDYNHNLALLAASGIDNSSTVPVGFIEPFIDVDGDGVNDMSDYVSAVAGSSAYCSYIYVDADSPSIGYGNMALNSNGSITIQTSTLVSKGATGTTVAVPYDYTGTILQGVITSRYSAVYAGIRYKVYALVTFKAGGVTAWYDTGHTFSVSYTE